RWLSRAVARLSPRAPAEALAYPWRTNRSAVFARRNGAVRTWGGELTEALTNQSFIALALLAATSLVAAFFAYIYQLKRRPYLLYWTVGWAIVALSYLGPVLASGRNVWPLQSAADQFLYAA